MALPAPPAAPVLRRLCSGPCADIWLHVTRHVRHPRNVKKIRGNLLWYQHLEETEGAPSPPLPALREALERLRQELGGLQEALGGAQRQALAQEEELGAGLRRRGAGLSGALRLRLLGEAAAAEGRSLRAALPATPPQPRMEGAGPELAVAVAMGTEPEVLVALRRLSRERAESLRGLLEPRPPPGHHHQTDAADGRWLRSAQEVLSRHPPGALLWALEQLALESTRGLRAPPSPLDLEAGGEAPPTVSSLLQERWGAVGGLWARLPPLGARLRPLSLRLRRLHQELGGALGGDPKTLQAARLAVVAAGLGGAQAALLGGVRNLGGAPPNPPSAREELRAARDTASRGRGRMLWRQRRLRALGANTQSLRGGLREQHARVQAAAAALGRAPEALGQEGQRLRELLGALGALGAPPLGEPQHGPPLWLPPEHPLRGLCETLGLPPHQPPRELLPWVLRLRRDLPRKGAGLPQAPPLPTLAPPPEEGLAELLPRLHTLANQSRRRIEAWPRLQALVSQWWEQPAQWVQATPPGSAPFSHWLQRWARATRGHAPCPRPRPLPEATPTAEGRGQEEPRP